MNELTREGFFSMRRPLRDMNMVLGLFEADIAHPEDLKPYILTLLAQNGLRQAIELASPDLGYALGKWESANLTEKKERKLLQAIFKYISRAGTRSTPFGLFAGNSLGLISDAPSALGFRPGDFMLSSRLDMGYAVPLIKAISEDERVYMQLRFYPNQSIYKIHEHYRFYTCSATDPKGFYQMDTLPSSNFIDHVLVVAKNGILYEELLTLFSSDLQDQAKARVWLNKLIQDQFFFNELHPKVTGEIFFDEVLSKLRFLNGIADIIANLETIKSAAAKHVSQRDAKLLQALSAYIPIHSPCIFQKDLIFQPSEVVQLNQKVIEQIKGDISDVIPLGSAKSNKSLNDFKLRFKQRYGDQMVPLLEALDPVYGLKYGADNQQNLNEFAPALKNVSLPDLNRKPDFRWKARHQYLSKMVQHTLNLNERSILLEKKDLIQLSNTSAVKLPDNLFVMGNLLASDVSGLDQGNFEFVMQSIGGPSATNLMTRFCHDDEPLDLEVKALLASEEAARPEAIIAEVVHLPEPRMGNVVMRPVSRSFEIPLLTRAGVNPENEIPLNDLLITLKHDRLVLYSRKFSKEVIPRITNAHNFTFGMPIYKLFGDLQFQDYNFYHSWDWGPFESEPFLPGVKYGKLVLQRARWLITSKAYQLWMAGNRSADPLDFIREKALSLQIDQLVVLKECDNELTLDLRSEICLNIIAEHLLVKDIFLYEFLFNTDNCILKDKGKSFVHELIIPFRSNKPVNKVNTPLPVQVAEHLNYAANFPLGSEWLYLKIYGNYKILEEIIAQVLLPLGEELVAADLADQWFFIRYKDPDHHIRLRYHHPGDPGFWTVILSRLNQLLKKYTAPGMIIKLETDTYQQEIWRYGLSTIKYMEKLFYADSVAIAGLIHTLHIEGKEEDRLFIALKNIDALMDDFSYTPQKKHQLTETLFTYFYLEHNTSGSSKNLNISLDLKYRTAKMRIAEVINGEGTDSCFKAYHAHLVRRSGAQREISFQLQEVLKKNNNTAFLSHLLCAAIHMTLNRLFLVNQRQHELLVYHHLSKYYESALARTSSSTAICSSKF